MIHRLLLNAFFLAAVMSPHLPLSLSAQGWEAIQAENFDGSGFSAALQGVAGFHAVGFVRSTYGSNGSATDTCALLQPYAAGSLIAMEVALDTTYEYRLRLTVKPFGENQAVQFSYHTAPSSGGTPIGWGVSIPSLSTDDPSLPGVDTASAVFMVNAAGTYWVIAKAFEIGAATGWVRYDDFVLERRLMEECLSVAGPDVEICQGDTVQVGTGCLPSPHPLDSLEYCYRWMPETGLDDPENAMPNASPEQTVTYRVYVTASDGELVAEDEVTVKVNTVEVRILPEDPSLCYRDMPGARPGRNAAPAENRAVGCTQEYVVLSLDGAYATAEWSTGIAGGSIEVYEPGLYSVSVTDANGCEGEAQAEVAMCTAIPLSLTASGPQLCEDTVAISAPEGFAGYQWSTGAAAPGIQATATGVYAVTVEDSGGCLAVDSVAIEECNPLVDIRIFDGFYDWAADTSWSGGKMVPDSIEASKGAVTVANLNDTDGDTIPDYQDMSVTASLVGRNEIDLMKLLVFKPQPYSGGSLKLRVLEGGQRVKFWKAPTKEDSLASASPNEYSISFANASDSLTYYLEATGHSDTLRDIVIEASYGGKRDTVAATAFWVDSNNVWFNRSPFPIPSYSNGSNCNCQIAGGNPAVMLSECDFFRRINCDWIASDMSRYGFGLCRTEPIDEDPNYNFPGDMSNNDKWISGRIFWEFRIVPTLLPGQYDELNLKFDVTRQKQTNTCRILSGSGVFTECERDTFPWSVQQDNEKPNDDSNALLQNDNTPSNVGLIYSFDPPGSDIFDLKDEKLAFKVYRATFKEYVRIKLSDFVTDITTPNVLEGSRASIKQGWHNAFYIRRIANGLYKMQLDTSSLSVSFPVKASNSNSNGIVIISINDPTIVGTNGYRIEYNYFDSQWIVKRKVNNVFTSIGILSIGQNGGWDGIFEGIRIQIAQGNNTFTNGDRYTFSTFVTQNPQGKQPQFNTNNQPLGVFIIPF